jgi:hypothetical protein
MQYRLPFTTTWPSTPLSFWTSRLAARPLTMMAGKHYKCQLHAYNYLSLSYLQYKHNILTLKHVSVHIFHFATEKKKIELQTYTYPLLRTILYARKIKILSFKCSWRLAMQLHVNKTNTAKPRTHSPPFYLLTKVYWSISRNTVPSFSVCLYDILVKGTNMHQRAAPTPNDVYNRPPRRANNETGSISGQ